RDDLLVGAPVSARTRVQTEPLIGLFLNTLALRATLSPDLTFREAVDRVRGVVLDALEHADVPVERVVQDLDLRRDSHAHPLYEPIFNFAPTAPRRLAWPDLTVTLEPAPPLIEEFSTQLFVTDLDGRFALDLRYRRRRYSEALMASVVEQYLGVLRQALTDPDRRLGAFDLTTAG